MNGKNTYTKAHHSSSSSAWQHQSAPHPPTSSTPPHPVPPHPVLAEARQCSSLYPVLHKWAGPLKWDYWGGTGGRNMTKQGIRGEWREVKERTAIYTFSPCKSGCFGLSLTPAWPGNDPWLPRTAPDPLGPFQNLLQHSKPINNPAHSSHADTQRLAQK